MQTEQHIQMIGVRAKWAPIFISAVFFFTGLLSFPNAALTAENLAAKIEKARELVLKGERTSSVKTFKDLYGATNSTKASKEVLQAWREVAELFLTDKGQNQAALAESFWLTRPKDAAELLLPLMKIEDGNLGVARLGARAAIRAVECARADVFATQAELTFPVGADVKLLRLQVQDCLNGVNANAVALKILANGIAAGDVDWNELEPAVHLLTIKDAFRRKELKAARSELSIWEKRPSTSEDPEFWYWKWKVSSETARDRAAGRKYLGACAEMTARRRKNFAMHPELCLHTESVESELKSSDKSGL